MCEAWRERTLTRRREVAGWVAVLCQVQGAKVTAADLLGEQQKHPKLDAVKRRVKRLKARVKGEAGNA